MRITKNPTEIDIVKMIKASKHKAVRRITDHTTGDTYCWPAEDGTHAQGASSAGVEYDTPAGMGEILTD